MLKELKSWFKLSLFSIVLVALYGVMMRYKIGFEFPFLEQKFLLEAHSHFAFVGWITQTLMVLMVMTIQNFLNEKEKKLYRWIFAANLLCAYSMLISFTIQGYGTVSIIFSTISILISYVFSVVFIKHLLTKAKSHPSKLWYLAAIGLSFLSTLGTFALVFMMATKNLHQTYYLAAVYYFLHFQYNGWFFFACMGVLWDKLSEFIPEIRNNKSIFRMLAIASLPAYFLSTLWMDFPSWLYWVIVLAAAVQVFAWGKLLLLIRKHLSLVKDKVSKFGQYLFLFVTITCSIKFLLQLFSTIPIISKLAFGFRPIVIAYLHLVLLAVISVFLLTWLFSFNLIKVNKLTVAALTIFICGVFLNEFALMIQGIASFAYFPVPYINETLFGIAVVMLAGAILLFLSQGRTSPDQNLKTKQ